MGTILDCLSGEASSSLAGRTQLNSLAAAVAGVTAEGFRQNATESFQGLSEDGELDPYSSIAAGAAKTALDRIVPSKLLAGKLHTGSSLTKAALKEGTSDAILEGTTEGAQAVIDMVAQKIMDDKPMLTRENAYELAASIIGGAGTGGTIGGGTAALNQYMQNQSVKEIGNQSFVATEADKRTQAKQEIISQSEDISKVNPTSIPVSSPSALQETNTQVNATELPKRKQGKLEKSPLPIPMNSTVDTMYSDDSPIEIDDSVSSADPLISGDLKKLYKSKEGQKNLETRLNRNVASSYQDIVVSPRVQEIISRNPDSTFSKLLKVLDSITQAGVSQETVKNKKGVEYQKDTFKTPTMAAVNTSTLLHSVFNMNSPDTQVSKKARRDGFSALMSPKSPIRLSEQFVKDSEPFRNDVVNFLHYKLKQPVETFYNRSTPDLMAEAYAQWHENNQKPHFKDYNNLLPSHIVNNFNRVEGQLNKVRNLARQNGITQIEDVFTLKNPGTPTEPISVSEVVENANSQLYQFNQSITNRRGKDFRKSLSMDNTNDWLNTGNGLFQDIASSAAKSAPMAQAMNITQQANADARQMIDNISREVSPIMQKHGPVKFNVIVDILDGNDKASYKGRLNADGYFLYMKDGKEFVLKNKEISQDLVTLQRNFEKNLDLRRLTIIMTPTVQRLFRKLGLPVEPTNADIRAALSRQDINSLLKPAEKEALTDLKTTVDAFENMRENDYVPKTRDGDWAVKIERKKENGKWELISMPTFYMKSRGVIEKGGMLTEGSRRAKAAYERYLSEINKYKDEKDIRISPPYALTNDDYAQQLRQLKDPVEILQSIIYRNKGSADSKNEASSLVISATLEAITAKGALQHFRQSRNIGGYNTDWYNVLPKYFVNMSYFYARSVNTPRYMAVRDFLKNNKTNADDSYVKMVNDYIDYNLNFSGDTWGNHIRMFNFLYALGGNAMSGALQFVSIPTTILPELSMMTNYANAARHMVKAGKDSAVFYTKPSSGNGYEIIDMSKEHGYKALAAKGYSEDKILALKSLYFNGVLGQTVALEAEEGNINEGDALKLAGFFLKATEEMTRVSTAMATLNILDNPTTLQNFHQHSLKNNERYRLHLEAMNSTIPDKVFLTQLVLERSLGIFGKEGRSPFARSAVGNLLAPFSTWVWQVGYNRFFRRMAEGPQGKKATIYATLGILATAGMWGLPGVGLLRYILERILSSILDEEIDLEEKVYELFGDNMADDLDKLTVSQFLTHGLMDWALKVNLSPRVAMNMPGQQTLQMGADTLLGVEAGPNAGASSVLAPAALPLSMFAATAKDINEDRGVVTAIGTNLTPVALQNMIKANIENPNFGKQYRGVTVQSPEDASQPWQRILSGMGLRTYEEGIKRRNTDIVKKLNDPFAETKQKFKTKLQNNIVLARNAENEGDMDLAQKYWDKVSSIQEDMIQFTEAKGMVDAKWISDAYLSASQSAEGIVDKDVNLMQQRKKQRKEGRPLFDELMYSQ